MPLNLSLQVKTTVKCKSCAGIEQEIANFFICVQNCTKYNIGVDNNIHVYSTRLWSHPLDVMDKGINVFLFSLTSICRFQIRQVLQDLFYRRIIQCR